MKPVKLELTWIGKENRLQLEPPTLVDVPAHSHLARTRTAESVR